MIKLIAFDLDGTLAYSKSPINSEMVNAFSKLLDKYQVCIITGGTLAQIDTQVIDYLPYESKFENLHLMPTCGTRYLTLVDGAREVIYENNLDPELRKKLISTLEVKAKELGFWEEHSYGAIIEDRYSQVTYSALGQEAPLSSKEAWDPDSSKKEKLRTSIQAIYPDLEVRSGGSTSIDITEKGIDKAFGIRNLAIYTGIQPQEILFIGDRLDKGGNDFPVIKTGVNTYHTKNPEDTLLKINELINKVN